MRGMAAEGTARNITSAKFAASSSSAIPNTASFRTTFADEIMDRISELIWMIKGMSTDLAILKKWMREFPRYERRHSTRA